MEILFNDSIPCSKWEEFLNDNNYSTPFQSPEFYKLFNSVGTLAAEAIAVLDSELIKALVVITFQKEPGIKKYFSQRGIIYGGPLLDDKHPEALELLLNAVNSNYKGRAIYIETRNLHNYSVHKLIFKNAGWSYKVYLNFRVSCTNESCIWQNMNRLRKRQIKKALENNVTLREAKNMNDAESLYKIIHQVYKFKIKKPLPEWQLFNLLYKSGFSKVFIIEADNKIIGGHFCLIDNKVIYDWYGCGLDVEYRDYAPSTMAVYSALLYGAKNKLEYFDFMGAGTPNEKYGVREFKSHFGGELVEHGRFILILKPILYKIGKLGIKIISKLG